MDGDRTSKAIVRRPEVLRKLNTESLLAIERGLLGDLPDKLKPQSRARSRRKDLEIAKPNSFLTSCLPSVPDSPGSEKSDEEQQSPLKKSFSFRDKFSRISFLRKDKDKKVKTIVEDEVDNNENIEKKQVSYIQYGSKADQEQRASKRFWFFRNKEIERRVQTPGIYKRSKSFEFLPKALEEEEEEIKPKSNLKASHSYALGSTDSMGDAWASSESLDFLSTKLGNLEDSVFTLSTLHEPASVSSKSRGSSLSTMTSSNSSGIVANIFKRDSVQDLLDEFHRTVDMFSENYVSDCETYTKPEVTITNLDKRKSSSFSTLPSPKIVKVNPLKPEVSDEFKRELSIVLKAKQSVLDDSKNIRRGSVTDWFVLEDQTAGVDDNKYRRATRKKPTRVRRISSTKYWITSEKYAMYSREQRPPLVIPRISQHRPRIEKAAHFNIGLAYPEDLSPESPTNSPVRQCDRFHHWSPASERGYELDQYRKTSSGSPPFVKINKRMGGSTENLLGNMRRPNHLQLPASSSGDSLDVEIREKKPGEPRSRKSRSVMEPKHAKRSPVPAPRSVFPAYAMEALVVLEGPIKRTKFAENGKKCKKNWTDCYMVLTHKELVFFKDKKNYMAIKNHRLAGTPTSPSGSRFELLLHLTNAHVVNCIQTYTRRYTKSLMLTVGYDYYLLQDETEDGAKRWLSNIQRVIYRLGPPNIKEIPVHHYDQSSSTDLESLGRTPPVTRHNNKNKTKSGGSSNEDLSDSTDASIQKSQTRSKLRKFFAIRPSKEMLEKKGIYQDEPVFGRKLEEVCPAVSPRVPDFVVACIKEIEKTEVNLRTDGLYRASGNLSQVQKIRLEIDQSNLSVLENSQDIHVLTGSLKLFFRELKEPVIPCNMFVRALSACSIKQREARIKEFRDIIQSLPQCNRETLKFLLEHLLKVTQRSEHNRMHSANLAIVFGPTILWAPPEQAHNIAIDCIQQNNVVDMLLTDFHDIFTEDSKGKKK